MSDDKLIPASPDADAYAKTADANAAEIFDRDRLPCLPTG
jgi:hypothetical protein